MNERKTSKWKNDNSDEPKYYLIQSWYTIFLATKEDADKVRIDTRLVEEALDASSIARSLL